MGRSILVAVSFLTRLPVKVRAPIDGEDVAKAAPYFALVGVFLGLTQAGVYWLVGFGAPVTVAAVCSVISLVVITGAFHYDGLADAADAFVGGWNPQQRREILKDSRLGTYGVMALVLVVALEISLIGALTPVAAAWGLASGHALSRAASVVAASREPASGSGISAAISGQVPRLRVGVMVGAAIMLVVISSLVSGRGQAPVWAVLVASVGVLLAVGLVMEGLGRYARSKVGTVNGDTLGAIERCCFCVYLLGWVILHTS